MRENKNIATFKEWLALTFGVLAAIAIVCSQTLPQNAELGSEEVKKELPAQSDDENDHHEIPTINQNVVSSFAQVTLTQSLHFISDIYQPEGDEVNVQLDQKVDFNSFFKTLFRLIISPNAP